MTTPILTPARFESVIADINKRINRLSVAQNKIDGLSSTEINVNPVTNLAGAATRYLDKFNVYRGSITATWTAPTTYDDGITPLIVSSYVVNWFYTSGQLATTGQNLTTSSTSITFNELLLGTSVEVDVYAKDKNGRLSAVTSVVVTVTDDSSTVPVPSTPAVISYIGQMKATWDGKDSNGNAMPANFQYVEVHWSLTSGFTPTAATLAETLHASGSSYYSGSLTYGQQYYCKLIAVNKSLNKSAASAQGSAVLVQAADGDIASLNVGKLVAGTLSADVILGNRIRTAATGNRVEIDTAGIRLYKAAAGQAGTAVCDLNINTGTVNITGTFSSSSSGGRVVIGGSVGTYGTAAVALYSSGGSSTPASIVSLSGTNGGNSMYLTDSSSTAYMSLDYQSIYINSYYSGSGNLAAYVNLAGSNGTATLGSVDSNGNTAGQVYTGASSVTLNIGTATLYMSKTLFQIQPGNTSTSDSSNYIRFISSGSTTIAPYQYFVASGGYTGVVSYSSDATTANTFFLFQRLGGTPIEIRASKFTVTSSSEQTKTNIKPYDKDSFEVIQKSKVYTYNYLDHIEEGDAPDFIGLIIERSDSDVVILDEDPKKSGIDVAHMVSINWHATDKLIDKIKELESRVKELEHAS